YVLGYCTGMQFSLLMPNAQLVRRDEELATEYVRLALLPLMRAVPRRSVLSVGERLLGGFGVNLLREAPVTARAQPEVSQLVRLIEAVPFRRDVSVVPDRLPLGVQLGLATLQGGVARWDSPKPQSRLLGGSFEERRGGRDLASGEFHLAEDAPALAARLLSDIGPVAHGG